MKQNQTSGQQSCQGKAVLIAVLLGLILAADIPAFSQAVGPPTPQAPAAPGPDSPVSQMKNTLKKLFKKDESASAQEGTSGPVANPYGTTTPDISDPASARRAPVRSSAPASKTAKTKAKGKDAGKDTGKEAHKTAPQSAPGRPPLLTQPPLQEAKIEQPTISEENPPVKLVTLDNPNNPLGFADALSKLNHVGDLIDKKEFVQAKVQLTPLRQWLVDSTEAHIGLYKALNSVSSAKAQAELEKQLALQFALLRDRAMFQMGTISVQEKNYKSAVKDLTEVIKSQPRSEMGLKSYSMLQEIGFTEKLQIAD